MVEKKKTKMGKEIEVIDLEDDDLPPKSIPSSGRSTKDPISVEEYTQKKRLLSELVASLGKNHLIHLINDEDDEVEIINDIPRKKFRRFPSPVTEMGQSSKSEFTCEICVDSKPSNESFNINGCSHSYCSDCMVKYVASKIQENITIIKCPEPNCRGVLEPQFCHSILPPEVFDRWCKVLCESLILESHRFYCPFKDCSALLVNDGGMVVKESECPHCKRMFCAQCKVPWHLGISCEDFQKSNDNERGKEDLLLMQLAKKKNWQRCPKCNFYVEKSIGCNAMICRCGTAFCYNCGVQSGNGHFCPPFALNNFNSLRGPVQARPPQIGIYRRWQQQTQPILNSRVGLPNRPWPGFPGMNWLPVGLHRVPPSGSTERRLQRIHRLVSRRSVLLRQTTPIINKS